MDLVELSVGDGIHVRYFDFSFKLSARTGFRPCPVATSVFLCIFRRPWSLEVTNQVPPCQRPWSFLWNTHQYFENVTYSPTEEWAGPVIGGSRACRKCVTRHERTSDETSEPQIWGTQRWVPRVAWSVGLAARSTSSQAGCRSWWPWPGWYHPTPSFMPSHLRYIWSPLQ